MTGLAWTIENISPSVSAGQLDIKDKSLFGAPASIALTLVPGESFSATLTLLIGSLHSENAFWQFCFH